MPSLESGVSGAGIVSRYLDPLLTIPTGWMEEKKESFWGCLRMTSLLPKDKDLF